MPKIKEINGKLILADGQNALEIKIIDDHTIFSSTTGKYTFQSDDETTPVEVTVGQNIITSEPTQPDFTQTDETEPDYIWNKPAIWPGEGSNAILEGNIAENVASAIFSKASGTSTTASGNYSHAQGYHTTATGAQSHSEGYYTEVSGQSSHAEGNHTTAAGDNSHSEGVRTIAKNNCQHVFGKHNIADTSANPPTQIGNYVEIVGNGADTDNRSNARTLDWFGNEVLAGGLTTGGDIISNGINITQAITGGGGSGQIQSNWLQTDDTAVNYISNRPAIQAGGGTDSIVEGDLIQNTATGNYSHAEGYYASASGANSHAEGSGTKAIGVQSHAEGAGTTASGADAHTEGRYTTASGDYSHAEGYTTTASGDYSHAEGSDTTASGDYSHAEGQATTANHKSQHVYGEYNIADPSPSQSTERGTYVEIVGNGEFFAHSNARTLDWFGNEVLAGGLTTGGDVISNGINISEAISTAKLRVNGGSLQASVDGGTSWHTINFAD